MTQSSGLWELRVEAKRATPEQDDLNLLPQGRGDSRDGLKTHTSLSPRLKRSCSPNFRRCRMSSHTSTDPVEFTSTPPLEAPKRQSSAIKLDVSGFGRSPSSASSASLKHEWAKLRESVGCESPTAFSPKIGALTLISPQSASAAETPPTTMREGDLELPPPAFTGRPHAAAGRHLEGVTGMHTELYNRLAASSDENLDNAEAEDAGMDFVRKPRSVIARRTPSDVASRLQQLKLRAVSPRRHNSGGQLSPRRTSPARKMSPTRSNISPGRALAGISPSRRKGNVSPRMRRPVGWHSKWSSLQKMDAEDIAGDSMEKIPRRAAAVGCKAKLQSSFDIELPAQRPRSLSSIGAIQPWPERDEEEFQRGKALLKSLELDPIGFAPEQLCHLALEVFMELDLPSRCNIPVEKLQRFIVAVKERMFENPYHNWIHVFDVTQTVYALGLASGLIDKLDDWDRFALICAALCHDLEHPGVNNMFLSKSKSSLAMQYRDKVLEKHHSLRAFELMVDGEVDLLRGLNTQKYYDFRKRVTNTILATDMARHADYVKRLKSINDGFEESDKQFEMDLIMKCADTSNVSAPYYSATDQFRV